VFRVLELSVKSIQKKPKKAIKQNSIYMDRKGKRLNQEAYFHHYSLLTLPVEIKKINYNLMNLLFTPTIDDRTTDTFQNNIIVKCSYNCSCTLMCWMKVARSTCPMARKHSSAVSNCLADTAEPAKSAHIASSFTFRHTVRHSIHLPAPM